jgi:hypothetical protein
VISNAERRNSIIIGVTALSDTDGAFAAAYHPGSETCYLVRPDGYICYRARPVTESGIFLYLDELGFQSLVQQT